MYGFRSDAGAVLHLELSLRQALEERDLAGTKVEKQLWTALKPLKSRSQFYYAHSLRVGLSMLEVAQLLKSSQVGAKHLRSPGWEEEEIVLDPDWALLAGITHDIGKGTLRDELLDPCRVFSPAERLETQIHVVESCRILTTMEWFEVSRVVGMHHHHQPQAYPDPRQLPQPPRWHNEREWEQFKLLGWWLAITDAHDSINSRPYCCPIQQSTEEVLISSFPQSRTGISTLFSREVFTNLSVTEMAAVSNSCII